MVTSRYQIVVYLAILMFLASCGPKTLYTWNGYDEAVLEYYENPAEREDFIEALEEVILESEDGGRIPPGLYAEYGYVFYEEGVYDKAILYFQKEHDVWPESRIFMNKMIRNANMQKNRGNKNPANLSESNETAP